MKTKTLLLLLLSLTAIPAARGQEQPVASRQLTLTGYGFYDFHYATGDIGGGALILDWQAAPAFRLSVGAEYASSNRIAAKLCGQATLFTSSAISPRSTCRSSPVPCKWHGMPAT